MKGAYDRRIRIDVPARLDQRAATFVSVLLRRLRGLIGDIEITTRAEAEAQDGRLAAAQASIAAYKARAAALEVRIETLEGELAEAALVALDLRARLVCLRGKLSASAATARYEGFASALKDRVGPE